MNYLAKINKQQQPSFTPAQSDVIFNAIYYERDSSKWSKDVYECELVGMLADAFGVLPSAIINEYINRL